MNSLPRTCLVLKLYVRCRGTPLLPDKPRQSVPLCLAFHMGQTPCHIGFPLLANLILPTPWSMIPFVTPIQVRRLREQTIYSRPQGKDVMELEPHQVPLTPDTKLLPTHCLLKSSTQQKQLMGCLNRVTGYRTFWAALWWEFLAPSKVSYCSGLSAVLGYLYLSIRYNVGNRDLTEIFRTAPLLQNSFLGYTGCLMLLSPRNSALPPRELQPGEASELDSSVFSLTSKGWALGLSKLWVKGFDFLIDFFFVVICKLPSIF